MALLVRSWNRSPGKPHPPERGGFPHAMIRLVSVNLPDEACLQGLPVWAL